MTVNFDRERQCWDAKAYNEDQDGFNEAFNKALRRCEIERQHDGVHTIQGVWFCASQRDRNNVG